ncbi:DUF5050 domain-containing protein [Psychrobacillus sp. NPDC096426]|uniref:DUF5050 domain-containing protein n=1 Tax=Psychrobacillus sp. NPDC096426 TaxID=3364491 RepID=UPI0037FA436F
MNKTLAILCTFIFTIFLLVDHSSVAKAEASYQVSSSQKTAAPESYEKIKIALLTGQATGQFDTSEIDYLKVGELINQVTFENPEIMYYSGARFSSNGTIEFYYSLPTKKVIANQLALQQEVDKVLSSIIRPNYSDFDKVKAIHDYIALSTAYDWDNYLNGTVPADSYTAYGSLIQGIAVCDGYAKAAQLLMNRLGIENYYVYGTANGGLHSWNLIKLNGTFYWMDITWDDPAPNQDGYVRYSYFLITSDQLRKDHTWEEGNWPIATSNTYSYFNDFNKTVEFDGYYYYSSQSDLDKLYKIAKNGSNKQKVNNVRAPYFAIYGDTIYFSNYSNSGYMYKMKLDGSSLAQMNSIHSTDIQVVGNTLTYLNNVTNKRELLPLDNIFSGIGQKVTANKTWTITFNQEVDPSSIKKENILVKTENGENVTVTLQVDPTSAKKVLVQAPSNGYKNNTNYTLFIQNVKAKVSGKTLKTASTKNFYIQ